MSRGNAPEDKSARRRRLIATTKAKGHELEVAINRARAAAAQAIAPHDPASPAAEHDHSRYVVKTYVHRETGSRIRVLDTQADDVPRSGLLPVTDGSGGRILPYAVECLDHDSDPQYFPTLRAATKAVRRSGDWCQGCAVLPAMPPRVLARNKKLARPEVRL